MDTISWSGRPDPVDPYGYGGESETDYKKSSSFFEDDILSESDNDLDIDASQILGEDVSSDEEESNGENQSVNEEEKDENSNYLESDSDQDSVEGYSLRHRIDPSAHEPDRYDDRYRIKPDPFDGDDIPEPYNEESIRTFGREDEDGGHDIENPSVSFRSFGFGSKNSQGSFDADGSFEDVPSKTESRGESGIEVEEIVEFDSISKKMQEGLKPDGFDDEPKEESNATVQTSRERRIIAFLSIFVICLISLLLIAIAVGIGLGVSRNKKPQPTPTPTPLPTFRPTGIPTSKPTTLAPSPKPTGSPTMSTTDSPTSAETQIQTTNAPVAEPQPPGPTLLPTTSPDSQNTELLQLLIENSLDEGDAVMTTATPQNKAYKWLSTNAFLNIYSDEQILTRYALATFFYATNGPTTWDSFIRDDGWLTDAPECEWGSTANNQCTKGVYTSLTLDFMGVSGTIPQELGLLSGLERFSVRGSEETSSVISGTIPDIFGTLSNMQTIRLNDNGLGGLIPASIGSMKNCIVLILSGNSLIGKIPTELSETQARTLNLSNNQLSGQIPSELFSLTELKILNLQDNNLSGTIPTEIGDAITISNVNFSNNQLGGSIPSEIGNLVEIRSAINFSSNKLSGVIPPEIGRLNKMSKFS